MQYMAQPPGSLPGSNIVTSTTPDISESRDSTPTEIDDVAIAALEGGGCMSCRAAGGGLHMLPSKCSSDCNPREMLQFYADKGAFEEVGGG